MSLIIIAGMSAVGKKTLIRKILGDAALQERFGVTGRVYAVGPQFDTMSSEAVRCANTVLFQWQVCDHHHIEILKRWMPDHDIKTYFLFRDEFAHYKAHRACKHEWQPKGPADLRIASLLMLKQYFTDYGPIELIEMSED